MSVEPSWALAIGLVVLVTLAVVFSRTSRLGQEKNLVVAAIRAVLQLAAISGIIVAAVQHVWSAALFACAMFVIGVVTTVRRTEVGAGWPWTALAMAAGVAPTLTIIFGLRIAPLNGISLIPIAGIITGAVMTAHTLTGRRVFADLRGDISTYEAGLSIGLVRADAIDEIISQTIAEGLVPSLDQTRTVGLVTLPGAFVGVLLGGGSPLQAGAAQVLVLVGILTAQVITVSIMRAFMLRAKLLPADLKERLRP